MEIPKSRYPLEGRGCVAPVIKLYPQPHYFNYTWNAASRTAFEKPTAADTNSSALTYRTICCAQSL
jgi:hypothetical protein